MKKLNIGLFGFGCVGSGLHEVLNESGLLNAEIKKICIKHPNKKRSIDNSFFTTDKYELLNDPDINVIVELIDDADEAYEIVKTAFVNGKDVVSANKKLIAEHFAELQALKDKHDVNFIYEASVCGSIPIIRNLEEYYNNDSLKSLKGICNGTTNYILTKQIEENRNYEDVLKEAQALGFAESEPTLDVDGWDSKFKLKILAAHAFGLDLELSNILNYGIRNISIEDVNYAKEKGFRIKLISRAEKIDQQVIGFVAPHFVNEKDYTYAVENENNAVEIEGAFADKQLFLGKGAGSLPTASAVLSDVSALQFGYDYELRKFHAASSSTFTNDYEIKVFASSNTTGLVDFPFTEVEESFQSAGYSYKVGKVNFSDLLKTDYNKLKNVFFAIVPQEISLDKSKAHKSIENVLALTEV